MKGYHVLADLAVPDSINLKLLEQEKLASGMNFAEVVSEFFLALQVYGGELLDGTGETSSFVRLLSNVSPERTVSALQGTMTAEENTEWQNARPQKLSEATWMVGGKVHDVATGWTWQALETCSRDRITGTFRRMLQALRDVERTSLIKRLLITADTDIGGGGGTGKSRGICNGATSSVSFTPDVYPGMSAATSTHTHLQASATNTSAQLLTQLGSAVSTLREHPGGRPDAARKMYLLHSTADKSVVSGMSGFARPLAAGMSALNTTTYALNLTPHPWVWGSIAVDGATIEVVEVPGYVDDYYSVVKTFGSNSPDNPLRRWYNPDRGLLAFPMGVEANMPAKAIAKDMAAGVELGFGITRPDLAVNIRLGNASWADPAESAIV